MIPHHFRSAFSLSSLIRFIDLRYGNAQVSGYSTDTHHTEDTRFKTHPYSAPFCTETPPDICQHTHKNHSDTILLVLMFVMVICSFNLVTHVCVYGFVCVYVCFLCVFFVCVYAVKQSSIRSSPNYKTATSRFQSISNSTT